MNKLKELINDKKLRKMIGDAPLTAAPSPTITPFQYGWICPKCGAVMAPNQTSCTFCVPVIDVTPTITCTGQPYNGNYHSTTSNT